MQGAAVVELEPAPAAVNELALAGDALQQVQETAVETVDPVSGFQLGNAEGTTHRTPARGPHMVPEPARDELLPFALLAFVNCHIAEALEEGPVNAAESCRRTTRTYATVLFIAQFATAGQLARQ